jgi:hypothetical protein
MPQTELSPEETAILIDYARRKYAEKRWPLAPELRSVRDAIEKLRGKRELPVAPAKPYEPSTVLRKKPRR